MKCGAVYIIKQFCAYITKSANSVVRRLDYDISYTFTSDLKEKYSFDELYGELSQINGVADSSYGYFYRDFEICKNTDRIVE